MFITNVIVVDESEFGQHPDTHECKVLARADRTNEEIEDFVDSTRFCAFGARIITRGRGHAIVRYYA